MHNKTAQMRLTGYTYRGASGVCPRLMAVCQCLCIREGYGSYRHPQWLLDYSLTPFGRFRIGRNAGPWTPRSACEAHLYAPATRYWEDMSGCGVRTARSIYIAFSGGEACGLSKLASPTSYTRFLDPQGKLGERFGQMLTTAQSMGEHSFWMAQALLCEILGMLRNAKQVGTQHYLIQDWAMEPEAPGIADKVRRYLQEHIAEPVRRQDLASHLNLSISTLAHRYREETGQSPIVTLIEMRINLAKSLLLKGHQLKDIAVQVGFCDAFQLSRVFKRHEGLSPRQFLASLHVAPNRPQVTSVGSDSR